MNLIEAVKSGKPYRRKPWLQSPIRYLDPEYAEFVITTEDIIADDWEVKEEE